jgi:hypothetical protein
MKKFYKDEVIYKIFPVIILPVSTTIISIIISKANKEMELLNTLLSIFTIFIVLLILCISTYTFLKKIAYDITKNSAKSIAIEAIKFYEEKQEVSKIISDELFTLKDILEIEKNCIYNNMQLVQVDIIASSFNYDISDEYGMKNEFKEIVVKNTNKNIEYNLYITDNPESLVYASDLNKLCKQKLNIYVIGKHFFLLMKDFDFSIYYLKNKAGFIERIGFMSLSNLLGNSEIKDLYHVVMADTQVSSIVSILPESITKKLIKV